MVDQAQKIEQDASEESNEDETIRALFDATRAIKDALEARGDVSFAALLPKVITFYISQRGTDHALDISAIPLASIIKALTYGLTQYVADGAAVDVHERNDEGEFKLDAKGDKIKRAKKDIDADKEKGIKARLDALASGEFKTGGGGKTLSAFDVELRALVKNVLVKKGCKLADAVSRAKKPRTVITVLSSIKARETVKAIKDDATDEIKEKHEAAVKEMSVKLFDENWKVLTDTATKLAAEHKEMKTTL